MQLTPQQQAIANFVDTGEGNGILNAVAGSGKTTTLVEVLPFAKGSVQLLAFNKAIAMELQARCQPFGKRVKATTFHAAGLTAWSRQYPNAQIKSDKLSKTIVAMEVPDQFHSVVKKWVSLAKQEAVGITAKFDDDAVWMGIFEHHALWELFTATGDNNSDLHGTALAHARKVFRKSADMCKRENVLDFDDMLFAPLLWKCPFTQTEWVFVDEAQDTNVVRRMMAGKMLKPGGRLLAVGDPFQAIYGFTGATSDAMTHIYRDYNCSEFPLSVCFRCDVAIVQEAQQWVPHITAAPGAREGSMFELDDYAEVFKPYLKIKPGHDAFLCRNLKPLVKVCYDFIKRGTPAYVEGRDIAMGLVTLTKRFRRATSIKQLEVALTEYAQHEYDTLMKEKKEAQADSVMDRAETILTVAATLDPLASVATLCTAINDLFGDTEEGQDAKRGVCFATVHKAKGREWDRVFLIDRAKLMPSKYATQEWQVEQETNLLYVAVTRAKHVLVDVPSPPTTDKRILKRT